jgi:ribosome biogenesis protein Nip4
MRYGSYNAEQWIHDNRNKSFLYSEDDLRQLARDIDHTNPDYDYARAMEAERKLKDVEEYIRNDGF